MAQTMAQLVFERGDAQGFERGDAQGFERGDAQGFQRGAVQAKQEALLKLLQSRFNAVPDTINERITVIRDIFRLGSLFDNALNAETLEEIDSEFHERE